MNVYRAVFVGRHVFKVFELVYIVTISFILTAKDGTRDIYVEKLENYAMLEIM